MWDYVLFGCFWVWVLAGILGILGIYGWFGYFSDFELRYWGFYVVFGVFFGVCVGVWVWVYFGVFGFWGLGVLGFARSGGFLGLGFDFEGGLS